MQQHVYLGLLTGIGSLSAHATIIDMLKDDKVSIPVRFRDAPLVFEYGNTSQLPITLWSHYEAVKAK